MSPGERSDCVQILRETQNADGGWGFFAGAESRVEPTGWALIALKNEASPESSEAIASAARFLGGVQLPDGSWPSAAGQTEGSWVTSLACWALNGEADSQGVADCGFAWLCGQFPREKSAWLRWLRRLAGSSRVSRQSDSLYGWSWTANTSSWVEPTAYGCLALQSATNPLAAAASRLRTAEQMLYDRLCPGGGWNAGNPNVYGVAGSPEIGPTAWALLALRGNAARQENQQSLDWLQKNWNRVPSIAAAALSCIALQAYSKSTEPMRAALPDFRGNGVAAGNVPALAWSALALSENESWLPQIVRTGTR